MSPRDRARADVAHLAQLLTSAPLEALESLILQTAHHPTQDALCSLLGTLSFAGVIESEEDLRRWREGWLASARREVTAAVCSRETIVLDGEAAQ